MLIHLLHLAKQTMLSNISALLFRRLQQHLPYAEQRSVIIAWTSFSLSSLVNSGAITAWADSSTKAMDTLDSSALVDRLQDSIDRFRGKVESLQLLQDQLEHL